jgi:hypothetical protein
MVERFLQGGMALFAIVLAAVPAAAQTMARLHVSVVDEKTDQPLAARVYLQADDGSWHFVRSADAKGSAVEYRKQRGPRSAEMHTTVSAHPFSASVPPGRYTLTVERGKEYFSNRQTLELRGDLSLAIRLRRWADLASQGWYSGETHVHRSLDELPTAMLADDVNVALPLTYWVTRSDTPPSRGDKNSPPVEPRLTVVDPTHVIYPMNTEYEIFTVGGKSHTLGAVFALNHKNVLDLGTPPVRPIAQRVRAEGGLLELDKHNWPWSMMLIPVMNVDLYELTNNHVWRTEFFFGKFGELPPPYMNVERNDEGFTERGWLDFTFQNYYLLLDCGYRLRPTAGTASGVHPVPLGWGRVYVHLTGGFSYDAWIKGLNAGRSFVTTGPVLLVTCNGRMPGEAQPSAPGGVCRIEGTLRSAHRQTAIEIVSAGRVVRRITPDNRQLSSGAYESSLDESLPVDGSTWFAVRGYEETPDGRLRFAHAAPCCFDDPARPLRPRPEETEYLVGRMKAEIARHRGVLSDAALAEFQSALADFERLQR